MGEGLFMGMSCSLPNLVVRATPDSRRHASVWGGVPAWKPGVRNLQRDRRGRL